MASNADDTAPRASSIAELRQMPHGAASYLHSPGISKRRAIAKKPIKRGFSVPRTVHFARQFMPLRQNFPPRHADLPALPARLARVTRNRSARSEVFPESAHVPTI